MTVRVGIALARDNGTKPQAAVCYVSDGGDIRLVHFLALRDLELAVSDLRHLAKRATDASQAVIVRTDHAGPFAQIPGVSLEEIRNVGKRARKATRRGLAAGRIVAAHPLTQADLTAKAGGGGVLLQALALAAMS